MSKFVICNNFVLFRNFCILIYMVFRWWSYAFEEVCVNSTTPITEGGAKGREEKKL